MVKSVKRDINSGPAQVLCISITVIIKNNKILKRPVIGRRFLTELKPGRVWAILHCEDLHAGNSGIFLNSC